MNPCCLYISHLVNSHEHVGLPNITCHSPFLLGYEHMHGYSFTNFMY